MATRGPSSPDSGGPQPTPRTSTPKVASRPKATPHRMIETVCQKSTALREAPKETIAAEVIWLGRMVWPTRLTPATPYLSKAVRSRRRLGDSSRALSALTLSRTALVPRTRADMEAMFPATAAPPATGRARPATTPLTEPASDSTHGMAPATMMPSHWYSGGRPAAKSWIGSITVVLSAPAPPELMDPSSSRVRHGSSARCHPLGSPMHGPAMTFVRGVLGGSGPNRVSREQAHRG